MSRTYRHKPFKFIPHDERVWIDWRGEQRTAAIPTEGWHIASKHFNDGKPRSSVLRLKNRKVRRDRSWRDDWDNYTLPPDKPWWWD